MQPPNPAPACRAPITPGAAASHPSWPTSPANRSRTDPSRPQTTPRRGGRLAGRSPAVSARASASARAFSATMNSHRLRGGLRKLVPPRRQHLGRHLPQSTHAEHSGALLALGTSGCVYSPPRQPALAHRVADDDADPVGDPDCAGRKVAAVQQQRTSPRVPGTTNTDPEFHTSLQRTRSRPSGTATPSVPVVNAPVP